jgi:hypothetical protein
MSDNSKRKRSVKPSVKQRIECFMNALPDLNPNWDKPVPTVEKYIAQK